MRMWASVVRQTGMTATLGKFSVREARPEDAELLNLLVNSAYRGESSKKGWTTEADFLGGQRIDADRLREMIAEPNQKILCLLDESRGVSERGTRDDFGEIVGAVNLKKFEDSGRVGCYLGMLTVKPTAQASGLGRTLLQEAEKVAREWGADHMTLTVIQIRTELMAWYERRGYRKTGETEDFPYGDVRFGEPKRDDLHFVVFEKPLL